MHAQRSCTVNKETLTSKTQCKDCKKTHAKESPSAHVEPFCKNYQQKSHKRKKKTTAKFMILLSGLQWRIRTRGLTRHLRKAAQDHQAAKHHFWKAQHEKLDGCAELCRGTAGNVNDKLHSSIRADS